MSKIKILDSWTFNRPFPEPFASEVAKRKSKTSTDPDCISVINNMTRGKRSTLHPIMLNGFLLIADAINGEGDTALGTKMEKNKIINYSAEYTKTVSGRTERRVLVYETDGGRLRAVVERDGMMEAYPRIYDSGASGKEIFGLLAYASMRPDGPLYNIEFTAHFVDFVEEKRKGFPDIDLAMRHVFVCCDNLYRRLENAVILEDAGIPLDNSSMSSGNIGMITVARLKSQFYSPTKIDYGKFLVLTKAEERKLITIGDMNGKYNRHFPLSPEEKALVPVLPETYQVPEEVTEMVEAVCNTPMRIFMCAGESGTGKTTNAKMVAQLLGLPYYVFTCGEGTDEVDLVSSLIPNIGNRTAEKEVQIPSFMDMMMDPASALANVSGTYEDGISQEDAFQKIISHVYDQGFQKGHGEKDYVMVESSIITACRRPALVEIQEPSVITKPGTLVKLNGLLDDGASITLTSGETVKRNPETIIILTTNMGYKGCRGFNESVLSRMRMILYSEPLTAKDMVKRVQKRVTTVSEKLLEKMADTVCDIQKFLRTEMISGGVCGYREYEDWIWMYVVTKDLCHSAFRTIVAKAAPEAEERDEIYKNFILTQYESINAV